MKYFVLFALIAFLASCEDDNASINSTVTTCTTCTRVYIVTQDFQGSETVTSAENIFQESITEGSCIMSHSDYTMKIKDEAQKEIDAQNALNPHIYPMMVDGEYPEYTITASFTLDCVQN